jgi:cellulose synthase/poly-beta-1,6-N-acetylglucosamine synthase-like glycosyltransferase
MMMVVFGIVDKPYRVLGLFFTRKFKPAKNYHKYAIVIPARNEQAVIGNLIDSIKKQDYPQELITIFVVADNCTDNTAQVARDKGAICYEHNNPNERTKGFGLRYLFDRIREDYGIETFEGYFIFDSDNLLKGDYISRMNDSFDAGEKIITSYRNTKNFSENWIASTYALHWLRSIRTRHRARSVLHLATNIQGTGFLFANEIVKDGWKYTSLTEDRALTADSVVAGYEISYNNDAVFYDEQPVSLRVALRQRLRWSKGHLQAFAESGWGLFKHIFVDNHTIHKPTDKWYNYPWRTIRYRFMSFDTFCQLLPKNIINIAKWILFRLILFPFWCWKSGLSQCVLDSGTFLDKMFHKIVGAHLCMVLDPGAKSFLMGILIMIWLRLLYRIGKYIVNIVEAIYLFIIEYKRMIKIPFWKKVLYCITWPTFDIIGRYTQYIALFKKVEWKPIPHESKVTIDDITANSN